MLEIRKMQPADLPRVVEVERACFGERWSLAAFQNELANAQSSYFVSLHAGAIVGYAGYWLILEEAHITTIGTDPTHQGRGFGERMLLHLIEHATRAEAKWLTLEVRVSNQAAIALYEKYGFTSLGRRRGYYHDNHEDALVMWTENIEMPAYKALLQGHREALEGRGLA
ncbi:MAG: ribosomal protein S18-alanine N-acetyltransferase [Candidatus Sericytochromatia bacterium]|nr:ribosomal protein S18-alanine N-acetyltransferase [Candidatus Sericytochromatia bacterium]